MVRLPCVVRAMLLASCSSSFWSWWVAGAALLRRPVRAWLQHDSGTSATRSQQGGAQT